MTDIIDIRESIERFEELEIELLETFNEQQKDEAETGEYEEITDTENTLFQAWLEARNHMSHDNQEEFNQIKELLEELKGSSGDEEWRGDWYPITLINDNYFEESMDELVKDCYDLDSLKIPAFIKLEIDYDMLKQDYTQVDYDGETYWYK